MKSLRIQYFAALREQRGLREETLETNASTAKELYDELAHHYKLTLPANLVKASINLQLKDLSTPIMDGDEVVFIPPVAGG
ncbi:MAG TPA: MoaD/ThiS family protein [Fimbriimonadaceae bacterium]|jgi:molybdopterin converting factor small subunit